MTQDDPTPPPTARKASKSNAAWAALRLLQGRGGYGERLRLDTGERITCYVGAPGAWDALLSELRSPSPDAAVLRQFRRVVQPAGMSDMRLQLVPVDGDLVPILRRRHSGRPPNYLLIGKLRTTAKDYLSRGKFNRRMLEAAAKTHGVSLTKMNDAVAESKRAAEEDGEL